jgi:GntR family transcriptional regulator
MDISLDTTSAKPLYEQIKEYIIANIQSGTFPPHSRIPSERDLAMRFGVSRLTVTKALKELEQTGTVYVRIGKGTFVAPESINLQLDMLMSFTEEMGKRGQVVTSRVLSAQIGTATPVVAQALNILVGTEVIVLKRVRMTNDRPIALEMSTLVASMCEDLLDKHNFGQESLYQVLRQNYGIVLLYAMQTIEARRASTEETKVLELNEGDPVLAITRITHSHLDKPIEYAVSAYRGDRYKFRAMLRNI